MEFPFIRAVCEPPARAGQAAYVVAAMMTPSHARYGERLAASCRAHELPLALFEISAVHRSIAPQGSGDVRCTKANFLKFLLQRYARPVLYLDVDCVVAQRPDRIEQLQADGVDFAIFNWLAEERTDAYVPTRITVQEGAHTRVIADRFYRFSHSIDQLSDTQLLCSGAVQWFNHSAPAGRLLDAWQAVIEQAPGCADDKCLDYAFNNLCGASLKSAWLDKSYARYAWWIYVQPVIDHPQFPGSGQGFAPLDMLHGRRRIDVDALRPCAADYVFPKDCLIDTAAQNLWRLRAGAWQAAGRFSLPLWLPVGAGA